MKPITRERRDYLGALALCDTGVDHAAALREALASDAAREEREAKAHYALVNIARNAQDKCTGCIQTIKYAYDVVADIWQGENLPRPPHIWGPEFDSESE